MGIKKSKFVQDLVSRPELGVFYNKVVFQI